MFQFKFRQISDTDIILGLQAHNSRVEKYFFESTKRYFEIHFNQLFFDKDSKEEIYQSAFIKLWTEIENKTIRIADGKICRKQKDGSLNEMTASLTTFLMAFAKNEFRELLRNHKDDDFESLANSSGECHNLIVETNEEEKMYQLIDECILSMSPNCVEILTLFYYQKKSLDEIMIIRGEKNSSKDGLKTAKNKCMTTLKKRVDQQLKRV